ncbi:MAG: LamG domain-containing protein, partial [Gammaproteobacteria bacterium]|nr:LamG domain-containing protein [Gammaproteobacteria bacterium]
MVLDADVNISDVELDALNSGNGDYNGASVTLGRNTMLTSSLGTNTTSEDLTGNLSASAGTKNIYNWYKDGNPIQVLNMPFEANGGNEANSTKDYSDNGNNGIVNGNVTWSATGGHDSKGAYSFGGAAGNDYIDLGDTASLDFGLDNFTISVWVKRDAVGPSFAPSMLGKTTGSLGSSDGTGYQLVWRSNNEIYLYLGAEGTDRYLHVASNTTLTSDGTYHHVAAVIDRANNSNSKVYVNGATSSTVATNTLLSTDDISSSGVNFRLGSESDGQYPYVGSLDDIQIFNTALSAAQIANLANGNPNIIDSEETTDGEEWQSKVTPNNGTVDGAEVESNIVTIGSGATGNVTNADDVFSFSDGNGITLVTSTSLNKTVLQKS